MNKMGVAPTKYYYNPMHVNMSIPTWWLCKTILLWSAVTRVNRRRPRSPLIVLRRTNTCVRGRRIHHHILEFWQNLIMCHFTLSPMPMHTSQLLLVQFWGILIFWVFSWLINGGNQGWLVCGLVGDMWVLGSNGAAAYVDWRWFWVCGPF